jgi:cobalamin-dependent methionine synthase I
MSDSDLDEIRALADQRAEQIAERPHEALREILWGMNQVRCLRAQLETAIQMLTADVPTGGVDGPTEEAA